MEEVESTDSGSSLNMSEAAASIASNLFGGNVQDEPDEIEVSEPVKVEAEPIKAEAEIEPEQEIEPVVAARPAPKSWAKDTHEVWSKLDPKAQEIFELREKQMLDGLEAYKGDAGYGKSLKEVLTPYKSLLNSQGVNEAQAVGYLLNAHYRLTNGSMDERHRAYQELGNSLGFSQVQEAPLDADPAVRALQEKLNRLESGLAQREQYVQQEARGKIDNEVHLFATDPAHPYFDEVADHIVIMLKSGVSLADAYEQAVWANPVTRQKEMARFQTENEAKMKTQAKTEAEAARKASGSNIRSRDTKKTPTEPKGSMEDTIRSSLLEIQARQH